MRACLQVGVLTLLLLGLVLQPILFLERFELVDDTLETLFLFELHMGLSEVLLVPNIREFARTIVLVEVETLVEVGQLSKDEDLPVSLRITSSGLRLMVPQ